jgi:hypothetical protein
MKKETGTKLNMMSDDNILSVNSPLGRVGGPYVVIHKDVKERWALVAMAFDDNPTLGMRWFWGSGGSPFARQATWFIIPKDLHNSMLDRLCSSVSMKQQVVDFLCNKIPGKELKSFYNDKITPIPRSLADLVADGSMIPIPQVSWLGKCITCGAEVHQQCNYDSPTDPGMAIETGNYIHKEREYK